MSFFLLGFDSIFGSFSVRLTESLLCLTYPPILSSNPPLTVSSNKNLQPLRYRMGQAIIVRETMPSLIAILYSGQARLLGYPQGASAPTTLALLQPGSVLGWISTVRGIACETARLL